MVIATTKRPTISIDSCSRRGFFAVAVNYNGAGRRLTPSKCCGSWAEVRSWSMTPDDLDAMAAELTKTAEAARARKVE